MGSDRDAKILLRLVRAAGHDEGVPVPESVLLEVTDDNFTPDRMAAAVHTLLALRRVVYERCPDGEWGLRDAHTNVDATAVSCRWCETRYGDRAAWNDATQCPRRLDKPCEPEWVDYRGRNKIHCVGELEVTHQLHTKQQGNRLTQGRGCWIVVPDLSGWVVPISQHALVAAIPAFRDAGLLAGVHISDTNFPGEEHRKGIAVLLGAGRPRQSVVPPDSPRAGYEPARRFPTARPEQR